jgi:ATP-dependent RNA helicase DDX49/DBP8
MTSSINSDSSEDELHNINSSSEENQEFGTESPRKRRRLSPLNEAVKSPKDENVSSRVKKSTNRDLSKPDSTSRPLTEKPSAQLSFAALGISPWIVASLSAMQITRPTQIQAESIPPILAGQDCLGGSKTGSGKTVAFSVPILQKWAEDPVGIFALILTPTRSVFTELPLYFEI